MHIGQNASPWIHWNWEMLVARPHGLVQMHFWQYTWPQIVNYSLWLDSPHWAQMIFRIASSMLDTNIQTKFTKSKFPGMFNQKHRICNRICLCCIKHRMHLGAKYFIRPKMCNYGLRNGWNKVLDIVILNSTVFKWVVNDNELNLWILK